MVPIIVETQEGIDISKNRFLVSETTTGFEIQRQLLVYVKKEANLSVYFFIVDNKKKHRMLPQDTTMKTCYDLYKNQEGFLTISLHYTDSFW